MNIVTKIDHTGEAIDRIIRLRETGVISERDADEEIDALIAAHNEAQETQ